MKRKEGQGMSCSGVTPALRLVRAELPEVDDGSAWVRVRAAVIDPLDRDFHESHPWLSAMQRLRGAPRLGAGIAGVVERTRGSRFQLGQPVYGILPPDVDVSSGEYARAPEAWLARKPVHLSFAEAAALPLAGLTALHLLRDQAQVRAGTRVLVHGAASSLGGMALQLAAFFGCRVTAVSGRASAETLTAWGAGAVIGSWREAVHREDTFDVVFDASGRLSPAEARSLLPSTGHHLSRWPSFKTVAGPRTYVAAVVPGTSDLNLLRELAEARKIRPVAQPVTSLAQACESQMLWTDLPAPRRVMLSVVNEPVRGVPAKEANR
ncbi:MAG TPA: NAD(P)-dependent alcohol dehydrogenase [Myxococcaceae bacterium]|nr:NAD(P)-dependent alcohol dehydrogenase [Myxococcaceae bacterium]